MNKIVQNLFKHKIILLTLLLAFILRIYDINDNPKAMYGDELTLVLDAHSLLKVGQDQTGKVWPLFFTMGGGRPFGYIYATIPFVALLGPTALAARAVSLLSGTLIVLLIFLICRKLISEKVGFYSAFVAAVLPWELNLSRGGFESHLALMLSLLGFYLFILALKKSYFYLLSALCFVLAMQTYLTFVLTIPVFIILIIYLYINWKIRFNVWQIISGLLIALSLFFSIYTSINRGSKDRFNSLLITNQSEYQNLVSEKVIKERYFTSVKPELAVRLHNKYLEFGNILFQNYVKNFGWEFLILTGDKNPRHNPTGMGQIYWAFLPLVILGYIFLYKSKEIKSLFLLSGWLLIGPLATSLVGAPHAIRSSFMLPPLVILIGSGLYFLISNKVKWFKLFLLTLFIIQVPFFLYRFYFLAPNLNASFWSNTAKQAMN